MTEYDNQAALLSGERMSVYQRIMGRNGIGAFGSIAMLQRRSESVGGQNRAW